MLVIHLAKCGGEPADADRLKNATVRTPWGEAVVKHLRWDRHRRTGVLRLVAELRVGANTAVTAGLADTFVRVHLYQRRGTLQRANRAGWRVVSERTADRYVPRSPGRLPPA